MRWSIVLLLVSRASCENPIQAAVQGAQKLAKTTILGAIEELFADHCFDWEYHYEEPASFPLALFNRNQMNPLETLYWTSVIPYCDISIILDDSCDLLTCTHSGMKYGYSNLTLFEDYGKQNRAMVMLNNDPGGSNAIPQVLESWKATTGWSLLEWLTNLGTNLIPRLCDQCLVHTGFYNHYRSLAGSVNAKTAALKTSLPNNHEHHMIGFSLGSATSQQAMIHHLIEGTPNVWSTSFGGPRIGNQGLSDFVYQLIGGSDEKMIRVVNWKDLIAHVPFQFTGLMSIGSEVFFKKDSLEFQWTSFKDWNARKWSTGSNNLGVFLFVDIDDSIGCHTTYFREEQVIDVMACGGVSAMNSNINYSKPMLHSVGATLMEDF